MEQNELDTNTGVPSTVNVVQNPNTLNLDLVKLAAPQTAHSM